MAFLNLFILCLEFVKENLIMTMSSNYLDAAALKETFRRSPFKFANTKVPQGGLGDSFSPIKEAPEDEAPDDRLNIQTPFIESALSASRLQGKNSHIVG